MPTFAGKQPGYSDPTAVVDETGPQVYTGETFAGVQAGQATPTTRGPIKKLKDHDDPGA